jgi:Mannosyl-glycoprotein endo-beta-N-acetylglucosaminidase
MLSARDGIEHRDGIAGPIALIGKEKPRTNAKIRDSRCGNMTNHMIKATFLWKSFAIAYLVTSGAAHVCAQTPGLPPIISGPANAVRDCVTPARLMEFVDGRNRRLTPSREFDRRFSDIASVYKSLGECVERKPNGVCLGVRWDYAFFQMLFETNYLLFTGGVRPDDNNFAGIGATVSGKPGEQFSSIDRGVLAHLQHLLTYAGVTVQEPVAQRTRIVSEFIHEKMGPGRPVTFSDLAKLWAAPGGKSYAAAIEKTAKAFNSQFCK